MTFTITVKITQDEFSKKLGTILGIDASYIGVLSFNVFENKRSGYTVQAIFKILGPDAAQKTQELTNKVESQDPALKDAGFEGVSVSLNPVYSTSTSSTTGDNATQQVSNSMNLWPSVISMLIGVALCFI